MVNNKKFVRTHKEVAEILTERGYPMTAKIAWHLEKQALRKLALEPTLRKLAEAFDIILEDEESCPLED